MKYGEVSGVSYCRLSDPVNIPPNVHMLASTCFPHVFSRTLLSATSCGGFVLNISKLKLCNKKNSPHSNRVGIPPSPLRSGFAFASFYILVLYLFVNIQTHVYKIQSKPAPSHLLLQYVNIPSPGSPTRPLCQCPLSSWNRQLLADETSVNIVSRRAQVLCVHIILLCLVDTQSGTPGLCPLCVDTANSTCVSRIPSLPPRVRLQISPLVLRHLCLSPPSTCWNSCLGMPAIVA